MSTVLHHGLDALTAWRRGLDRALGQLNAMLVDQDLLDDDAQALAAGLRQRLTSDRLIVAFVAEFSRGKSELINALFFGDSGRRVMPATPGRTTMCPVELAWDPSEPPGLSLLDIDTRRLGQTVSALREVPGHWQRRPLPLDDPDALAAALEDLRRVRTVSVDEARVLGFWDDERPDDNPPRDAEGGVEVPAWRHALINFPHPMLERGLVVIDTPGLNAIGAEPELTLGLLPSAHATVFLLAADTGVTRSDLTVWRDHLSDQGCERFVVLNKIDALEDPLLSAEQVAAQLLQQCAEVVGTLGVPAQRVFPLSARRALTARIAHDDAGLAASGLPALEQALKTELLPRQSQVLGRIVEEGCHALRRAALRRLGERDHQASEQLSELLGLRGKSAARVVLMTNRLEQEVAEFESCVPRLAALRGVLNKQLAEVMDTLSSERVRKAVRRMRSEGKAGLIGLGASKAFAAMGRDLSKALVDAEHVCAEMENLLSASQRQLNTDFGFSLAVSSRPALTSFADDLSQIQQSYSRYLGLTQVWRQVQPGFMDQFARMLAAKLRVVFETASTEVELWAKAAASQIDEQLRERRRAMAQRREAFGRIQGAESELETSISDLETRVAHARRLAERIHAQVDALCQQAAAGPQALPPAATATPVAPVASAVPAGEVAAGVTA